jgi:peptide/nickel transport system substrate-binding protein
MADLRTALDAFAAGRLSRRSFLQRAGAAGLSAPLAGLLAADPAAARSALPAAQGEVVGPASDTVTFSSFGVDLAPQQILNGEMDLYLFGLKTTAARELAESNPDTVRLIDAPASTISLILNPAPDANGFNPFSVVAIRQAVQYLVDREFIAQSIYQGRAVPMYSHVSPLDYDELTVFETIRARDIRYDPNRAQQTIDAEMAAAGAARGGDGKWAFDGRPIQLKFVTRTEDERRDVGDLIRAALENAGFAVQPVYQEFGPATLAVYVSDPLTFQWHLYTEGWSRSTPDRYDFGAINQFAAPWLGNMPGWKESGFWQYENAELDTLGQRLYRGEFASREERDELYRRMTELALTESVRVWLVTALQSFPVRTEVQNVTEDLVGGPKSVLTLREASVPGREELRVGNLWVYTERTTWNPIGGFGDAYSADIYRNIVDPAILSDPATGLPRPFRVAFEVETAGPDAKLDVPEDAVLWDAAGDAWEPVGAGVQATSRVTYDFAKLFAASYHHGQPITPADVVYDIAQGFEFAFDEDKVRIETALGVTQRPLLETFRGYRLLEDDRLEVYVDYWHFEPAYIASYASPGGAATPWELASAMDDIVFNQRTGAYSDTAAARFSVPWLSLVTETDARLVIRTLRTFLRQRLVPEGVFEIGGRSLVTPEEAEARYQAAIDWFDQTNLLVVSQGPYTLTRYDPPAQFAELTAFRAEGYPFKPGDWNLGVPERLDVAANPPASIVLGEPISVPVTVTGPGAPSLTYVLVDPTNGAILASGAATCEIASLLASR